MDESDKIIAGLLLQEAKQKSGDGGPQNLNRRFLNNTGISIWYTVQLINKLQTKICVCHFSWLFWILSVNQAASHNKRLGVGDGARKNWEDIEAQSKRRRLQANIDDLIDKKSKGRRFEYKKSCWRRFTTIRIFK